MIRPTPKAVALFALSVPLALLITTAWPGYWPAALYLPLAILALMLMDACMMLPSRRLDIRVSAPGRLSIGQEGDLVVHIACPDWSSASRIDAIAHLDGEAESPVPVSGIIRRGQVELPLRLRPKRRGILKVPAVQLRWNGPLGLVGRDLRHACEVRIDVVPDIRGLHEEALRFVADDSTYGNKSQRRHGEGGEFDKLAEYAPGMDSRFIDWKRSARHRKILSKEFRQERNHQIILGLDTGHLMLEPLDGVPRIDHAIRAALLLGWVSLRGGDVVGGCGFDARFRGFIQPGRGMPYFAHLQRFAAGMDYHPEETNFTLGLSELNARLKRRGLVVIFSEFVDSIAAELLLESLQLLVRRHLVVFVTMKDPLLWRLETGAPDSVHQAAEALTAGAFLRERAVTLERIARLGVHCLDTPTGGMASALLKRYLFIKQKGLL